MIWAYLMHLSTNQWGDRPPAPGATPNPSQDYMAEVVFDEAVWRQVTERLAAAGVTMIVLDLGDSVRYDSHPEIALPGAWSPKKLAEESRRLGDIGLELIPKLNFSARHDAWLGKYGRMLATDIYREVCTDLITEVCEILDTPRFFHLGMDEEGYELQKRLAFAAVRQGDLWWEDLGVLTTAVEAAGVRPWVWADAAWHHPDEYYVQMPKSVLQSNWHYGLAFPDDNSVRPRVLKPGTEAHLAYLDLDEHGYDQIPGSGFYLGTWDSFPLTVRYCLERLNQERLLGFLQSPWAMTIPSRLEDHLLHASIMERGITAVARGELPDPSWVEAHR